MKITQELKDVIRSKLYKEADDKYAEESKRLIAARNELNKSLLQSDEYKQLRDARVAFEAKIKEALKDEVGLGVSSYYSDVDSMIPAEPVALRYTRNQYRMESERKFNQIIIKLSYGKSFEDITTTLAEFGIEL